MTESAAEHGVETTKVQFDLPVLHPDAPGEFPFRQSVQHVQHILNEFDRDIGAEVLLNETGQYGPKTAARVTEFQKDNGIPQPHGSVGNRTWTKLLQQWLPVLEGDL
jgi:peptidoglycan hydrolase-like protein with peptidoglycan-binding domain